MRILISCLFYRVRTGSELYIYDVAHELLRRGHQIRIHAPMIGELMNETDPDIIVSPRETSTFDPDVMLCQHWQVSSRIMQNIPAPVVYVVHSRLYKAEYPVISPQIKSYVAISDDIANWLEKEYNIIAHQIPNGVDLKRFHPFSENQQGEGEYIFIPGTIDETRERFVKRVLEEYKDEQLVFAGFNTEKLRSLGSNIKGVGSVSNIEDYYAKAKLVCGLFNGRVQYETWACGVPFRAFDENGKDVEVTPPEDLSSLSLEKRVDELEALLIDAARK